MEYAEYLYVSQTAKCFQVFEAVVVGSQDNRESIP